MGACIFNIAMYTMCRHDVWTLTTVLDIIRTITLRPVVNPQVQHSKQNSRGSVEERGVGAGGGCV